MNRLSLGYIPDGFADHVYVDTVLSIIACCPEACF